MSQPRLDNLRQRPLALDRLIDTTRALARQEEVKRLKRLRLRLKDRIAALSQPDRTTAKG